jgi:ribosomal-protein-serine acetyltransferase
MFAKVVRERLELRLIEDRHVAAVYDLVRRNLDHLKPWMPWATDAYSVEDARAFQRRTLEQFARNDGFSAGVFDRGTLVGVTGFHALDWANGSTSLGYWLSADAQGRGVMTAAAQAMVDHAVGEWGLNRVEIRCGTENAPSRAVAQRLGFVEEAVIRQAEKVQGRHLDHAVYGMLAADWRRQAST